MQLSNSPTFAGSKIAAVSNNCNTLVRPSLTKSSNLNSTSVENSNHHLLSISHQQQDMVSFSQLVSHQNQNQPAVVSSQEVTNEEDQESNSPIDKKLLSTNLDRARKHLLN